VRRELCAFDGEDESRCLERGVNISADARRAPRRPQSARLHLTPQHPASGLRDKPPGHTKNQRLIYRNMAQRRRLHGDSMIRRVGMQAARWSTQQSVTARFLDETSGMLLLIDDD